MAVRNPPSFLQNITDPAQGHTAQNDRLSLGAGFTPGAAALSGRTGSIPGPTGGVGAVTVLSNTSLRVDPFRAVIQGTRSGLQGQYLFINDAPVDLAIDAQAAGVSRKDLLVALVRDSAFAPDTLNNAVLVVVKGTAAASNPAEPSLGGVNLGNHYVIGVINVPPTGQSVTFTYRSAFVVAVGGIAPAVAGETTAGVYAGQYRDHPTDGLQRWTGTAWERVRPGEWVERKNTTYAWTVPLTGTPANLPAISSPSSRFSRGVRVSVWSSPMSIFTVPSGSTILLIRRASGCWVTGTNTPRSTLATCSRATSTLRRSSTIISLRPVTAASVSLVTICCWLCRSCTASSTC